MKIKKKKLGAINQRAETGEVLTTKIVNPKEDKRGQNGAKPPKDLDADSLNI